MTLSGHSMRVWPAAETQFIAADRLIGAKA
jgi:hypothetical protein